MFTSVDPKPGAAVLLRTDVDVSNLLRGFEVKERKSVRCFTRLRTAVLQVLRH